MPKSGAFVRVIPSAGDRIDRIERFRGIETALNGATSTVVRESVNIAGVPIIWQKILEQTATIKLYPDDGTTATLAATASAGGTTLQLTNDVLQNGALDPTGMLVMIQGGSEGTGEVRTITGKGTWTGSNRTVNVNRAWDSGAVPQSGAPYRLLYDLQTLCSKVQIKVELSGSSAELKGALLLYDLCQTLATPPTARKGVAAATQEISFMAAASAYNQETVETNYFHCPVWVEGTIGVLGVKFQLRSLSSGTASLWLAGA